MNVNQITTNQSQQTATAVMRQTHFVQQQLQRCYLCEQPKQDYSLTRSFSEIICRACLNYEGSERVEQLIAEARQSKGQLTGQRLGGGGGGGFSPVSPASSINSQVNGNEQNTQQQQQQQQQRRSPHREQRQETTLTSDHQTDGSKRQSNGNHDIAAALRNNCYFLATDKTTTTTNAPGRPERTPSIIDVESVPASGAVERQQRQDEFTTENHNNHYQQHSNKWAQDPTQAPATNHLRRSLTRSSSPTIVLDTSNQATPPNHQNHQHHQHQHISHQKQRELRQAILERQQRNQASAVAHMTATRVRNLAAAKATRDADHADHSRLQKDYCQSNECLDNDRAINRSFGLRQAATSPISQQQQQLHIGARNVNPSPPSAGGVHHPLDRSSQQVGVQPAGVKQTTKMNDHEAHQPAMPLTYPMLSHREVASHEQISRYQSAAAAAAAAAAYYKQLDGMAACVPDPESLHRIMQECNVYATTGACTQSGAPFYLRPQHIPVTSQQQARNLQSSDGRLVVTTTTTTANNDKQQASPTSLYNQYIPMAMAPYMTPNGAILCPSQYGPSPYHPSHHQLMRSAGPGMMRAPSAQYLASNAGSSYGPPPPPLPLPLPPPPAASVAADKRPPLNLNGELCDQDNHLRSLLTTSMQPVEYNPALSLIRSSAAQVANPSGRNEPDGGPKQTASVQSTATGVPSEPPPTDLEKDPGDSAACRLDAPNEDTRPSQILQILDAEGATQQCDKSASSKSHQDSGKKDELERRRREPVAAAAATPVRRSPASPGPTAAAAPPAKRLTLGFSPSKSMMSYETGVEARAPGPPAPLPPPPPQQQQQQSVAKTPAAAAPSAPATKQHMTRRSHEIVELDRGAGERRSPVSSQGNDKGESWHPGRGLGPAATHNGDESQASSKASRTAPAPNRGPEHNLYGGTNGTKSGVGKEVGYPGASKAYQNGAAPEQPQPPSGRGGHTRCSSGGDSTRESPTTSSASSSSSSSRKSKSCYHSAPGGAPNSTSASAPSSRQQQQQQQPTSTPTNMAHHTPLKCMACKERLEDRHFVQCPSVTGHKFCFGCSKVSIERQQAENKNLKAGPDRIFCPSGKRCHLANEQTPWTFMNSEIETIIRESSRQPSSATGAPPGPTNKLNGMSGNGGSGGLAGDYQISKQRQQQQQPVESTQQNGHSKQNNTGKIS